ncbi:hypothetical protein CQY20_22070 [Mycolicibacterium agri]|uniref:Uncharacterized protein n=1 Tax=Mycolicibacterium agri TaxID=36811 RepID=A0A2A7MV24_MYCAG|nr:hypothetical protein [Mycolicibacterium agri]PEG35363.1 hypothetical protein CQY20_22070 [Mycolicibacterium agri]GFG53495.1 hypothetical protein MAGR_49360 [Mycolicibacterium agri]
MKLPVAREHSGPAGLDCTDVDDVGGDDAIRRDHTDGPRPRRRRQLKFVKIAIVIMLAAVAGTFLGLCFYVVHRTGSVEGLADIGDTTLLSVVVAALAVAGGVRRK